MPPHHHHHHAPPHHFLFPEPDEARLESALGSTFARQASRLFEDHGCPPEPRILLELLLVAVERLTDLERQVEAISGDSDGRRGTSDSGS